MAAAAPAVLTMLAKTNKKANNTASVSNSDGLADLLGGVMSLAGGGSSKGGLDVGSILGSVLGGGSKKNDGLDVGDILGALYK